MLEGIIRNNLNYLFKRSPSGVPTLAQWLTNLPSIHGDASSIPGLIQSVKDLVLLLLWCRLAATAPTQPLAWELPHAMHVTKKKKNQCLKNTLET